jgi:hypothetical protein
MTQMNIRIFIRWIPVTISLAIPAGVVQATPSAMGCLSIENEENAMLWRNLCGHAIKVAYCSPNSDALDTKCGEGKDPHNPFYTHSFIIPAESVFARYHHRILRYDYAVCPASPGVKIISNPEGGFHCE